MELLMEALVASALAVLAWELGAQGARADKEGRVVAAAMLLLLAAVVAALSVAAIAAIVMI